MSAAPEIEVELHARPSVEAAAEHYRLEVVPLRLAAARAARFADALVPEPPYYAGLPPAIPL